MQSGDFETRLSSPSSQQVDIAGFAPGTVLAERYRIVAPLGRGGMGEVYRADDLRLGQPVALKFLPATLEQDPGARERLLAEVRNARTVSHPNICRVYDAGDMHGRYFLTMEYIDGEDLASLLRRIGRLPAAKALAIARQLCAGLAAAHERGVLHRDLKPANVMIDGRGQARITDFGLAVDVGPATAATTTGGAPGIAEFAGTPAYLAPERFEGTPATVQGDLYALGLVLYEIYTGRPAFTATTTTIDGWKRAHADSTPSHPSAIGVEIEPLVERAILRCLEKDPARRPASAAQLALALPGGDPLAAAIAAGETPSPELVAASGEEGTLPRRQAWLSFATCLVALALAVPLGSLWHLENLIPLRDPVLQKETARQIVQSINYTAPPADDAWRLRVDDSYMRRLLAQRAASARFTAPSTASAAAVIFCYRQAPVPLFNWDPFGQVTATEPAPLADEDAYVELDPRGRLLALRVGGLSPRYDERKPPFTSPDWSRLFAAAGLDLARFQPAAPKWPAMFGFDTNLAWEGPVGGESYRVEAAAYRGRPVQFRVVPASMTVTPAPSWARDESTWADDRLGWLLNLFITVVLLGSVALLSIVAAHNVRAGRGDRRGALRTAVAVFAAQAVFLVSYRHWTLEPLNVARVFTLMLGGAFFVGLAVWLYYLAVEPFVRRRWPHLLIAWTRLLDGRWRDPLVGRSLLAGIVGGLVAAAIVPGLATVVARITDLPVAFPWAHVQLHLGLAPFLANGSMFFVGPAQALTALGFLLIARMVVRRDRPAWAVLFLTMFGVDLWVISMGQPWAMVAPLGPVIAAAVMAAAGVFVLARYGLLACAVLMSVNMALLDTAVTIDPTRWYAWRTGVVVVLIVALAFWGFRNVLGRQSAFPAGALGD